VREHIKKILQREHIKEIRGAKVETPESANHLLKILRALLNYAVDLGWIAFNPAAGVKKIRHHTDGHHTWTESEIAQFQIISRSAPSRLWHWPWDYSPGSAKAMFCAWAGSISPTT